MCKYANQEMLIVVVSFAGDDKNYRMYKSATQEEINSSNTDRHIIKTQKEKDIDFDFFSLVKKVL